MKCKVEIYTNKKRTNYMYFNSLEQGLHYMHGFLSCFNATEQLHKGYWKQAYDMRLHKKLDKIYEIPLGFISLRLTTKGSKEIDKRLFEQLLKDIDNETF